MSLCRNRELDEEPSRKEPNKFPVQDLTVLKVIPASKSQSSLRKGKKRNTYPKTVKFKDEQDEVIQNIKKEPIIQLYGINDNNNNDEKNEKNTEDNKSEDSDISGIQLDEKLEREREEEKEKEKEKEKKLNIANINVPKKEEEKLEFSHDMNTSREEINNDNKKYYENIDNNNNEEKNNNNINEIKDDTKEKNVEKENEKNLKNDEKQSEEDKRNEGDKEIEKKEDNKANKEAIEEVKKNNEPINVEKKEDKKVEEEIKNDKIKENKNEETSNTSNTSNAINNEQNKNNNENAPKVNEPKNEKVEEEEYDEEEEEEEDEKENETKGKEQTEESKDKELLKYKSLINIIKVNLESKGYSKSELINKLEELFKTFPNPISKEDLTSKISEHFINLLELTIDSDKNELHDFIQVIIKLFDGDKDKIYQQLMKFMEGIEEQEKLKNRQSNRVIRSYIKDCEEKLKDRLKQEDIPSDKIISLQKIEEIIEETGVQLKDEHLNILLYQMKMKVPKGRNFNSFNANVIVDFLK